MGRLIDECNWNQSGRNKKTSGKNISCFDVVGRKRTRDLDTVC
jgi:hypothetical protein